MTHERSETKMNDNSSQNIPEVGDDENITSVMIYTHNMLAWGQVVTKKAIKLNTWLRTPALPQYILLYDAKLITYTGGIPRPQTFSELFLPSPQVVGFHLKPPVHEPVDYDPDEPMRKMLPTTALIGPFRFDGYLRMSTQTNLERFLDVTTETFTSMYDLQISQPSIPSIGVIKVPMGLIRNKAVIFSPWVNEE